MTIFKKTRAERLSEAQLHCIKHDGELLQKNTVDSIDLLNTINSLFEIYLQTQDGRQASRLADDEKERNA